MSKTILAQAILTLYAYHLRTDINEGADKPSKKADQLWEQLVELGHTLYIPALQNLKHELICYNSYDKYDPTAEEQLTLELESLLRLKNNDFKFDLRASIEGKDVTLNGELSPFRLHDTYAIDFTLSCNDTLFIDDLKQLNPQKLLLPQNIQASIGQTLILYAELKEQYEDYESLADDCVAQLVGDEIRPQPNSQGKLLNNLIFEYETLEIEPSQRCHILIWFINNKDTPTNKQLNDVSSCLLNLLCARHKILSAYNEYQDYSYKAEDIHSKLENHVKKFEEITSNYQSYRLEKHVENFENIASSHLYYRLEKFKDLLIILPTTAIEYSKYQWYISDYETTITTNIRNYESSFKRLLKLPNDNLYPFREFVKLAHKKYIAQIQIDRQYLEPSAKLFQQLIDTVRGIVSIDQAELEAQKAEREKELEILITSVTTGVGAGLALSSVSAAVLPKPSGNLPPVFKNSIGGFSFLIDVSFHLLLGLAFAIFIGFTFWKIGVYRQNNS